MARQIADVEIHASDTRDLDDDNLDVSVDLIDDGLYLGNLACARDHKTLEQLGVTHILTVDLVPLPRSILDQTSLIIKYIKLADVPKEDLITHLPECNDFIKDSIANGGKVLVHCYFGVSRSASVVIGYIMEKYGLCYEDAFVLVKSKRRFIGPNNGFVAQLKLFGHMEYRLNRDDPRYKQFRLKMAGQKLKQVKILPQCFADLIKPDPGLIRERPDPIVYRCKKCRRIVASQSNIIPHIPKQVKVELAKKNMRPPPSKHTGLNCAENGQLLIEKLKNLACQMMESKLTADDSCKCPCGQKVAPAFYLVPSKVEWSNIVQNVQTTV
ncbi:dual specificity protein phosphatase 12 [Danaus plexippus plexippus]|uniref:Dual specificity protein phosphatase 12 n=1 Tax=Danaus plexippus plexippus TaxID=278856 RepID=A0A212F5D4_DANPL|nr:dual specificity protein phosphatase 12 [Danaus plexippus plexippus]